VKSLFQEARANAMKRPRLWRLRVAFSVVAFVIFALLVVLWVRSYYYSEGIIIPGILIMITHWKGEVAFHGRPGSPFDPVMVEGIPYLLVVLPAAVLPALPWLKWSRRFSIRAMLIITAVAALALAALTMSIKAR
jgi:hypothetical protein